MLRMAHRIATTAVDNVNVFDDGGQESFERCEEFKRVASHAICVIADNVQNYIDYLHDDWGGSASDYPGCIPFSSLVLVEWRAPACAIACRPKPREHAALIHVTPASELDEDLRPHLLQTTKHFVRMEIMSFDNGELFHLPTTGGIEIDEHGNAAEDVFFFTEKVANEQEGERYKTYFLSLMKVPLLAMSFANCKNVTRTELTGKEVEPDRPWVRKHNPPQIKYHVLNINPMKEVLRTEGRSDEVGIQKALHLCRGHFAHYSEEKPLFGKYAGQFWVPQHTRGKAERGMVLKDYSIGPVK